MVFSVLSYCSAIFYTSDFSLPKSVPHIPPSLTFVLSFLCSYTSHSILFTGFFICLPVDAHKMVSFSGLCNVFLGWYFLKKYLYSQDSKVGISKMFHFLILIYSCLYLFLGFPGKSTDWICLKIYISSVSEHMALPSVHSCLSETWKFFFSSSLKS